MDEYLTRKTGIQKKSTKSRQKTQRETAPLQPGYDAALTRK